MFICFVSLELPHQHVCKEEEEEDHTDQQPGNNNCSLDQEYPEPPRIKEELYSSQEEEEVELKHETEFLTTSLDKETGCKEGTEKLITRSVNTHLGVIYPYSSRSVSLQSFYTNLSVRRRTFSLTMSYVARIGTPAWT